jgi:hypothetical protein
MNDLRWYFMILGNSAGRFCLIDVGSACLFFSTSSFSLLGGFMS